MSEMMPLGWYSAELIKVVPKVQYGVSSSLDDGQGVPVLRMNNLHDGKIDVSDVKFSTSAEAENLLLQPNDVLFNRTNSIEHVGRTSLWHGELPRASFASYLVRLTPDLNKLDPEYLVRWLNLPQVQIAIRQFATPGVHQVNINPTNLRRTEICLPQDVREQRKIARILTTMDHLIEKTESLIAKYQAIKQGMMHDLFTRGVDAHGHLRPPQAEAPDLYKQSELGWIPKEWEINRVGDYLDRIEQGWSPDCDSEPASAGEWGVLKTTAVVWDGFEWRENKRLPARLPPIPQYEVRVDDVLMTRGGPNSRVGVVAIVRETRDKLMLSDKLYRLIPKKNLQPAYLALALSSERTQTHLSTLKTGLAESQTNISQQIVRRLWIGVPGPEEQRRTCERITAIEKVLHTQRRSLSEFRVQKTGLMQDLLTGKVRVKVDEAEEVAP